MKITDVIGKTRCQFIDRICHSHVCLNFIPFAVKNIETYSMYSMSLTTTAAELSENLPIHRKLIGTYLLILRVLPHFILFT